jgi:hypothetical protein
MDRRVAKSDYRQAQTPAHCARALAEFCRQFLGLHYRQGDEPPIDRAADNADWLVRQRERAEALGARLLLDRTADSSEPLYVLADPSGHPFCILVA